MDAIIWLVLMIVFLMIEGASVAVVSLWFGAGALVALIAALLGAQIWLQAVLFFAVSIVLLALLRPLARKYFTPKLTRTNVDSVIGSTGTVTEDINNITGQGRIKLASMEWTARSTSGEPISAGTLIRVDRIEGVKAFVSPLQVEANV